MVWVKEDIAFTHITYTSPANATQHTSGDWIERIIQVRSQNQSLGSKYCR